jgi:glycosyltransferase involved in cell wall biosynthesis
MKVSLITICYNSSDTIEETIQSVLNQTYQNIEYIIVDGKSTDQTLHIIEKYQNKIAKVVSEKDNGLYDAINKGIKLATGEIIGLIHADDVLAYPEAIEDIVKTFHQNLTSDCVYADLVYVNRNNINKVTRTWISGKYKPKAFLWGWMPPHPTCYFKKAIIQQHGFYRTDLKSAADYEFLLRYIHKHKINLSYLPKVTVKMRIGGESNVSLKNRILANKMDRKAWEINQITPYFFTLLLKPLRKIVQFI